jgi:hypothetical protein
MVTCYGRAGVASLRRGRIASDSLRAGVAISTELVSPAHHGGLQ